MKPQELDTIMLFIDELAIKAFYGYAGEKPLAILAALETASDKMRKNNLTLSQALTTPLIRNEIKRNYIQLAQKTGKLKSPESSWSNIVASKEELLIVLRKRKTIDEEFKTITKERAEQIIEYYYSKLP